MEKAHARVLIASRSPVWCAGLATFLSVPPLEPFVALTVEQALARLGAAPHVLAVIGARLADAPGADLAADLRRRHPHVRLLAAVEDDSPEARGAALRAGAWGCILPTWTREAVLEAVWDALATGAPAPAAPSRSAAGALTARERAVLRLMRQRLTDKEIAQRLGLSWHTVRTHAQSVLRKSGVHSRRDLQGWDAVAAEAPW